MSTAQRRNVAYGLSQGLIDVFPFPIVSKRSPTVNDFAALGTLWINSVTNSAFVLTSIVSNVANWSDVTGGTGSFTNIALPNTNTAGTMGEITFGGVRFISNFGTLNTFVGAGSGNTTTTGTTNTGIGATSLLGLTSGSNNSALGAASGTSIQSGSGNVAVGFDALLADTTGSFNTAVGTSALNGITTGSNNIGLGNLAGSAYTAAEASNIVIGNIGVIADANTIRIGTDGVGAGQQSATFIAGAVTTARAIVATTGDITSTAGNLVASTAGKGVVLGGGAKVVCGTGDPNGSVTAPQGSLYLNLTGSSGSTRAFINSNSATTWIAVTTAS